MTDFEPHIQQQCVDGGYAVWNPHGKSLEELPFIWGFNNGGQQGLLYAALIAQDGTDLGSHICSDEGWMPFDLGVREGQRPDRHVTFQEHYPDGYVMDFVSHGDVPHHPGLQEAFRLNAILAERAAAAPPTEDTQQTP